jgi:SAM-dependent methyltransferase
VIRTLPTVIPAPPGKPVRPGAAEVQRRSREIAEVPGAWTPESARQTVATYAQLAAGWDGERGDYRAVPLVDALRRGGPLPAGTCLEVGCGTGLLTPWLEAHWAPVPGVDLSVDMLARSRARYRLRADAAALPVATGVAAAVVLADVPLLAGEVVRVLALEGVVIWSNALGTGAPHHVPVGIVAAALERASGVPWSGVTASAGWGTWAVLRR